ncbi:anti-sigma factor domain-containing protein [Streptomyces sp. NPDC058001]|uniref:anti-sigma factor n=1 Tax=Streptomyces sp. NPDC058001 TaxID=3346300 RepID=UPI0036F14ED4
MSDIDPHTLTGAYALNALPGDERESFERHLGACAACAREVDELTATTARLGLAVSVTPPPAMRDHVLRRVAAVRQEPPRSGRGVRGASGHRSRPMSRFALAACLVAAALGGVAVWQQRQAEQARQEVRAEQRRAADLAEVLAAPDARTRSGPLGTHANATVVVSRQRDRAVFVTAGMSAPPSGKVYQLWFADKDGTMRPAGLLDPTRTTNTVLMDGTVGGASGMGVTIEPTGGSPHPTTKPLTLLEFPAG